MRSLFVFLLLMLAPVVLEAQLQSQAPLDTVYTDQPGRIQNGDIYNPWKDADDLYTLQRTITDVYFNGWYDTSDLAFETTDMASSGRYALTFLGKIWSVGNVNIWPRTFLTGADSAGVLIYARSVAIYPGSWAVTAWVLVDSVGVRCSPDTIPQVKQATIWPSLDSLISKTSTGHIQFKYVVIDEGDDVMAETSKLKIDHVGIKQQTWNGTIQHTWRRTIR